MRVWADHVASHIDKTVSTSRSGFLGYNRFSLGTCRQAAWPRRPCLTESSGGLHARISPNDAARQLGIRRCGVGSTDSLLSLLPRGHTTQPSVLRAEQERHAHDSAGMEQAGLIGQTDRVRQAPMRRRRVLIGSIPHSRDDPAARPAAPPCNARENSAVVWRRPIP